MKYRRLATIIKRILSKELSLDLFIQTNSRMMVSGVKITVIPLAGLISITVYDHVKEKEYFIGVQIWTIVIRFYKLCLDELHNLGI